MFGATVSGVRSVGVFAAAALASVFVGGCDGDDDGPAGELLARVARVAALDPTLGPRLRPGDGWRAGPEGVVSPGWRAGHGSLASLLPARADGAWQVGATNDEAHRVRLTLEGARPSRLALDGGRALYRGVQTSTDLIVVAGVDYAEQILVLGDERAPTEFSWRVELPPTLTSARKDGHGGIDFVDAGGVARLHMPRAFAVDADGQRRDVSLALEPGRIVAGLDRSGLRHPILLDPVIEIPTWRRAPVLEARVRHAMAQLGNKLVLFGGATAAGGELDDTWEFDGSGWTLRDPAHRPSARRGHAMAQLGNKLVLFGGSVASGPVGDTWEWDGNDWTKLNPPQSPPRRSNHRMTTLGETVLLFGGESYDGVFSDTWIWNGTTWTQASPAVSPPSRRDHGLATLGGVAVLFGGLSGEGSALNDTWVWNGTSWAQFTGQSQMMPPGAHRFGMAAVPGKTIVFVGSFGALGTQTWQFSMPFGWAKASPAQQPSAVTEGALAAFGGDVIFFGGIGSQCYVAETWRWDGSDWTTPVGLPTPASRHSHAMASLGNKVLLFGGRTSLAAHDETWEFDGLSWQLRAPTKRPYPRSSTAMAPHGNVVVLFGGAGYSSMNDTWEWDGVDWTERTPATKPDGRSRHKMASLGTKVVMFGGASAAGVRNNETWEWDGTNWTLRNPNRRPSARVGHSMAALGGKVVLFGGMSSGEPNLSDTWEWDGTNWTQLTPAHSPPARFDAAMATLGDRVVLFGGRHSYGEKFNDTWEWDGSDWTQRVTSLAPVVRFNHAMAALGGELVVNGGQMHWMPINLWLTRGDTWIYRRWLQQGSDCQDAADCQSGFCVDGHCCDSACAGRCEACDVPGSQGTCTAVVGAPRPAHGDCGGEGPCQGVCDGVDRAACVYPPEGTVCAPAGCSNGLETGTAHCDGAGACVVSSERPCGDYVCGATACLERCSATADCAGGRICEAGTGRCLPAMVPAECEEPNCPACSGGCAIGGHAPAAWLMLLGLLAVRLRIHSRRPGAGG